MRYKDIPLCGLNLHARDDDSEWTIRPLKRFYDLFSCEDNGREYVERTLDFSVHPHLLRHTCITHWFNQGLDVKAVQYLAGHATVDITLGIYTHYQAEQSREETARKIRATAHNE